MSKQVSVHSGSMTHSHAMLRKNLDSVIEQSSLLVIVKLLTHIWSMCYCFLVCNQCVISVSQLQQLTTSEAKIFRIQFQVMTDAAASFHLRLIIHKLSDLV